MSKGMIFDIKEFSIHDGPGIRTTVFLKGCPLHCVWCHNPEGISPKQQLITVKNGCISCGKCRLPCSHPECQGMGRCLKRCPKGLVRKAGEEVEAFWLAEKLKKQASFFDSGITISGGEPLYQPVFLKELLEKLAGTETIVETSGYASEEVFAEIMELADRIYLDIKHMDSQVHYRLTGVCNEIILKNLKQLTGGTKPYKIRVPLIWGVNDEKENLKALADELAGARNPAEVEFLPYNPYTRAKYEMVQMHFMLEEPEEKDGIGQEMESYYRERNIPVAVV